MVARFKHYIKTGHCKITNPQKTGQFWTTAIAKTGHFLYDGDRTDIEYDLRRTWEVNFLWSSQRAPSGRFQRKGNNVQKRLSDDWGVDPGFEEGAAGDGRAADGKDLADSG